MTQSAKENVIDTLKDNPLLSDLSEKDLEELSESIVKNLCIENQNFPKWE
jgi:hypothetical protein